MLPEKPPMRRRSGSVRAPALQPSEAEHRTGGLRETTNRCPRAGAGCVSRVAGRCASRPVTGAKGRGPRPPRRSPRQSTPTVSHVVADAPSTSLRAKPLRDLSIQGPVTATHERRGGGRMGLGWASVDGKERAPKLEKASGLEDKPGNDLLSHARARAVPSALEGLTSEFGMGSGMAPPTSSPENSGLCGHKAPDRGLPPRRLPAT